MEGETRKIQFTGRSTYVVSLPKRWVTDLGLRRGDQVRLARRGATTLEMYPAKLEPRAQKKEEATIAIGPGEEPAAIVRKLVSLYFLGFKTIYVRPGSGPLGPAQRNAVKGAVRRMLMGSEIISDSSGGITVQVLVNLLELSVDGAFKRMIHLAKSMSCDALLAARDGNRELALEVVRTDDEVDRFGFYIIRQLKIAIQSEHMLKEMGFRNARDCLGYRLVVKNVERTGDHAALVAKDLLEFGRPVGGAALSRLEEMNAFCLRALDEACLALFKEDYAQAERTISGIAEISGYEGRVREASSGLGDDEEVYRVRRMAENIRRVAEYASDIAEIVLNMNIEKALRKPG